MERTDARKKGVLLVNLGSPDSTRVEDVRAYLREFLMDPCVIDAPYPIRAMIVHGFILPFRPKHSAEAYASIWWDEGSPLLVIGRRVLRALRRRLDRPVALGMRYGNPSIGAALTELLEQDVRDVFLVPLYPHYAMATVQTVVDQTRAALEAAGTDARLKVMPPFYADPAYLEALAESAAESLRWDYDHLLFSYHGVPERHVRKTDPTGAHCLRSDACCVTPSEAHATCYRHQVYRTTEALAARLGLPPERYSVAFQSRLGPDAWLAPATARELERLAQGGVRRLLVLCPSFVADCLETLEEIGLRGRESFLKAGGEEMRLIPCLNDHPAWIDALTSYCEQEGPARGGP
ncbi:ferrochelatase [Rhodocaloribacter sp.]